MYNTYSFMTLKHALAAVINLKISMCTFKVRASAFLTALEP